MSSNGPYFSLAAATLAAMLATTDARAQGPDAPAHAPSHEQANEDPDAVYREAFVEGRELFSEQRWPEARAQFQRAYEVRAEPLLLFNIASTYRREDKLEQALTYYERFLDEAAPDDDLRSLADEIVAAIRMKRAAEEAAAKAAEPERPADEIVADPPRDRGSPVLRASGLTIAVAGVGALGWGAFEGYRMHSTASELRNLEHGTAWSHALQRDYDRGRQAQRRALYLSASGGVALVGGFALYRLGRGGREASPERPALSLTPLASPTSVGIFLHGHLDSF